MTASSINPIGKAWDRMVLVLFNPVSIPQWAILTFTAFLWSVSLAPGELLNDWALSLIPSSNSVTYSHQVYATSSSTTQPFISGYSTTQYSYSTAMPTTMPTHVVIVRSSRLSRLSRISFLVALCLLMLWLNARGALLFIDQLAHTSKPIARSWNHYNSIANNLAVWKVGLIAVACLVLGTIYLELRQTAMMGSPGLPIWDVGWILALLFVLFFHFVSVFMDGILAPAMYARRMNALEVWPELWSTIVRPNAGPIAAFYLFSSLIAASTLMLGLVTACCPCCFFYEWTIYGSLVSIPFQIIGCVVLLPLYAFWRLYGMFFVDQFAGVWAVFPNQIDRTCPVCNYNLRGSVGADRCPECGSIFEFEFPPPNQGP